MKRLGVVSPVFPTGTFPKPYRKVSRGLRFNALLKRLLKPVNPQFVIDETIGAISSEKIA
jgi:hypothetical protein